MRSVEPWTSAAGWRDFFDLLTDAVWVLDSDAVVVLANTAALRLLPCDAQTPISQLRVLFGDAVVRWLERAARGQQEMRDPQPLTIGARAATVEWRRLDAEHGALRLIWADVAAAAPPRWRPGPGAPTAHIDDAVEFLWDTPFPVLLMDAQFRCVSANAAFAAFVGRSGAELLGQDPLDWHPPQDWPAVQALRARLRSAAGQAGETVTIDARYVEPGGRERRCRMTTRAWREGAGRLRYLSVMQDTTEEHVARERADRSLRELDDWFELSPVGMVLFDERGLLIRTNPTFDALAGPLPVSLGDASNGLRELLGWTVPSALPDLDPNAPPARRQGWVTTAGGPPRLLRAVVRCYRALAGQRRYMGVLEDRSAEEERDLAQRQIDALIDTAGAGLATFQESSGWVTQGQGVRAGEAGASNAAASTLQSIHRDIVMPESLPDFERLQAALREERRAEVRYAIRHPELGARWLLTRVEPLALASGKRTTSVVTLDITEQHLAQRRTEQLLHELSTILESTTAGIAYVRGQVLVRCNRRFEQMLGLGVGTMAGTSIDALFGASDKTERIAAEAWQALAQGAVYETEFDVQVEHEGRQETRRYALSVRSAGVVAQGLEAIAVLSDVSRLKSQQQQLEMLARDRELMFSLSGVGIAFERDGRIQRANQALAQLAGCTVTELTMLPLSVLYANTEEFELQWRHQEASLRESGRWTGERQLRARDGRLLWVQASKRLVVEGDPAGGIIASYVDVDARYRAERAVALQADRTRSILDSVLVGIVTVGPHGIEWMNRSARRMFGGSLADFVSLPIATVATPEPDHPFLRTEYLTQLVEGQAETFECRVKARDGREFWVVGNVVSTARESNGRQLTYALLDIERRRQAEARVSQAQAQLQRIIEAAPLAITLRDAATLRVLQVNEVAAASAHTTTAALIGRMPEQIFEPAVAAQHRQDMETALASTEVTKREYRFELDGESRVWDARYLPLAAGPGLAPDQLLLVATDVTEQRAAQEARYEAAVAQREMLVKEVHHRIKNNLQGVAGLLQQIAQRKPEVAGPISEVVGQVQAIAQVYGLQVGENGPLQLMGVVRAITASVQRTFGHAIEFTVRGATTAEWMLPEAEAIPIALTLNELLTNAVKHAVAGPHARVRCVLEGLDDQVEVRIANLGELPSGFNLARIPGGVSGLGLVRALLPRRSASIRLEQSGADVLATLTLLPPNVRRAEHADPPHRPPPAVGDT